MGKGFKEQDWREVEKIKVDRWSESKSQDDDNETGKVGSPCNQMDTKRETDENE